MTNEFEIINARVNLSVLIHKYQGQIVKMPNGDKKSELIKLRSQLLEIFGIIDQMDRDIDKRLSNEFYLQSRVDILLRENNELKSKINNLMQGL